MQSNLQKLAAFFEVEMTNVKGKWALVTGANRGVGYRIAKFMASQGCNLILHSRSLDHTAAVLSEVKALGVEAYDVAAELSDPAQVQKMIDEINARGKPVDILFNDAAVQIAYRVDYYKTPVEDYAKSFYINTTSKAALDKVTCDLAGKLDGSDVCICLTDPGWCRTDLGGPNAPNDPDSVIPGICVGAFIDDKKSGRNLEAQAFTGMSLEDAVRKAEDFPQLFK